MQRIEFDKLEIIEQLNYINKELKTGMLSAICKNIGVGRSTMADRSKKVGYTYNQETRQYHVSNANVIQSHQSNVKVPQDSVKRDVAPIEDGITKEMQKYRDDLIELVNYKADLLEMLTYYKNNTKIIEVPILDMNELSLDMQKNIINKSIKIYKPIQELFDKVCSRYPNFKKQDMISLALLEFYNRYKK